MILPKKGKIDGSLILNLKSEFAKKRIKVDVIEKTKLKNWKLTPVTQSEMMSKFQNLFQIPKNLNMEFFLTVSKKNENDKDCRQSINSIVQKVFNEKCDKSNKKPGFSVGNDAKQGNTIIRMAMRGLFKFVSSFVKSIFD